MSVGLFQIQQGQTFWGANNNFKTGTMKLILSFRNGGGGGKYVEIIIRRISFWLNIRWQEVREPESVLVMKNPRVNNNWLDMNDPFLSLSQNLR